MKKLLASFIILLIACACGENKKSDSNAEVSASDTIPFFQVTHFIKEQLEEVQKTPYFIYNKTEVNSEIDSSAISSEMFSKLAKTFLEPDITTMPLKKKYTENIFYDETTKTISITYSTTDKTLEVQNVNVILAEDGNTVKRIFIRKFFTYTDSSAIEQLGWKPNESYSINRMVQAPGKDDKTTLTTIVWNDKK